MIKNFCIGAITFILTAGIVAGFGAEVRAEAGNGCTYPGTQLARKTAGVGPDFCRVVPYGNCVTSGTSSTAVTWSGSTPPMMIVTVYKAEWGGATSFPNCTADISNGPWQ